MAWISVKKQPHPEHGGPVNVTYTIGSNFPDRFVGMARFDCGRWDWGTVAANHYRSDSDIIAWQPLPKPYKGEI
jgi:hypothetical protein